MADKILKNIADGNIDNLKAELLSESSKPFRKQNIEKISKLSSAIALLEEDENKEAIERSQQKLYSNLSKTERKTFSIRKLRPVVALCCVVAVIMTANVISVSAWDMNIFTLIVEFTKGGVTVDFGQKPSEEIILPTSEDDPYGIIAKCNENNIYPDTPHYLPEGFVLTHVEAHSNELISTIDFVYEYQNKRITFHCTQYYGDVPKIGLASDEHTISEIEINGTQAIISKEDNQMNFAYNRNKYVLNIFTQDVDYSECDKIIQSIM